MPHRAGKKWPGLGVSIRRSAVHPRLARDRSLAGAGGDSERRGQPEGALYGTARFFVYAVGRCLLMLTAETPSVSSSPSPRRAGSPIGRLERDGSAACGRPGGVSDFDGLRPDIGGATGSIALHVAGADLAGSNAAIAAAQARIVAAEKMRTPPDGLVLQTTRAHMLCRIFTPS